MNYFVRITMGKGLGQSPGIPYVLEIWPKGIEKILEENSVLTAP